MYHTVDAPFDLIATYLFIITFVNVVLWRCRCDAAVIAQMNKSIKGGLTAAFYFFIHQKKA